MEQVFGCAARSTTAVQDDAQDDVAHNGNDLDDGEEELGFTVALDSEQIDGDDQDQEDGDPGVVVDAAIAPVLDSDGGSDDFQRQDNEPLHGITIRAVSMIVPLLPLLLSHTIVDWKKQKGCANSLPTHRKAPRGVDEACRVGREGSGYGEEHGHFSQGVNGGVHHDADEGESNNQRRRPSCCERRTRSHEQPGTNGTSNRNHLQVTTFQRSRQGRGCGAVGRAVDVEDSSIGADDGLGSGMGIRVALEAVDDSGRPFRLLSHVFAVLGQFHVVWRAQTGAVRGVIHLHCGLFRVFHIDGRGVSEVKCGMARCVARARRAGHRWGDAWNVGDKESGDKEKCPKRTTIPSKLAQRERERER